MSGIVELFVVSASPTQQTLPDLTVACICIMCIR